MLDHDEELKLWFDQVKEKRKGSNSSSGDDTEESEPVGGMMRNDLARGRR